ncbi:glutamate--tRNA ligase [Hyalangium gracile]|uniref:glutamate--tRNA ligase n=1 Tax=Hyalangium gracile TaxID=394092 RepID=UPI001CCBFCB5|nr:glutamate--tRNA ligase [Hyalangium gracile]
MTDANDRPIRVRIAPSPTGDPHVGTAYISLFNYAFAKQRGGKFLLRIEDTDQTRSTRQSEEAILQSLRWLGFKWDEGPDIGGPHAPYRQSERLHIYREQVETLVASRKAYWCSCTEERLSQLRKEQMARKQNPGYDRRCRDRDPAEVQAEIKAGAPGVVRLAVPREGTTVFNDLLRGEIKIENSEIDDQVLLKSDGFPTYHLANIVDDHLMGITHVMRGEEWITSTPKHVLLYQAFGWEAPRFAHLPLLRNADKSKVSKRKNPVSLSYFREAGYLPHALINFLGMMAFTFEDGREIFSLEDFVQHFKLERISLGGPVFDLAKLQWLNGRYLREKTSDTEWVSYLKEQLFSDSYLTRIVQLVRERVEKSEDFIGYADFFFKGSVGAPVAELLLKGKTKKEAVELYEEFVEKVDTCFDFSPPKIEALMRAFCEEKGVSAKEFFAPVRLMVTGKKATPPLFETMAVLGRERVRTRIRAAISELKAAKLPDPQPAAAPKPGT